MSANSLEFGVMALGSSSAMPVRERNLPAQILTYNNKPFLIDCGEGTQLQMRKFGVAFGKIGNIFISHLHGDHYFGLFGLLSTMNLLGRAKPLHLYAPEELKKIIDYVFKISGTELKYPLVFHELKPEKIQSIFSNKWIDVIAFPLSHSKTVFGFLFKEKPHLSNIRKEKIIELKLGIADIVKIKNGEDYVLENGTIIPNKELVYPLLPLRSYAYCSDTRFIPRLYDPIKGVNLLYHEATFAESDSELAHATGHSTGLEAAKAARLVGANKLLLGHFSSRYKTQIHIKEEAKNIFEHVEIVKEGEYVEIKESY